MVQQRREPEAVGGHLAQRGWATYIEWLWSEDGGGDSAQESFDAVMEIPADDPFWDLAIADPGPFGLFLGAVYDRGGDATLGSRSATLRSSTPAREWLTRYDDSTATTDDFEALFEDVSGEDLTTFFDVWVRTPSKPTP